MEQTIIYTGVIEAHTCGGCGIVFGMPADFIEARKEDHKGWYCPNGCVRIFTGKSKAEKLQEIVDSQKQRLENLHNVLTDKNEKINHLQFSNRALKAAKTKIINRVKNGVCPCCRRTFQNLQDHFKTVHPEVVGLFGKKG